MQYSHLRFVQFNLKGSQYGTFYSYRLHTKKEQIFMINWHSYGPSYLEKERQGSYYTYIEWSNLKMDHGD